MLQIVECRVQIIQIAALREKKGMTQAELARAIDSDVSTVRNLEKGRRGIEAIKRTIALCAVLECEAKDLIECLEEDDDE